MRHPAPSRRLGTAVVVAALTASTACTSGSGDSAEPPKSESPPAASPTSLSPSPTPSEVELALGEATSVTLGENGGRGERGTVRLAVTDVREGSIKDLSEFVLDKQTKKSTPYYADVQVRNTGEGNLSGQRLTLWALDSDGTVRPPADILGSFAKCQNDPMPKKFTEGKSARTCLLFLLPKKTTLEAVQYRPSDQPPYTWPVG